MYTSGQLHFTTIFSVLWGLVTQQWGWRLMMNLIHGGVGDVFVCELCITIVSAGVIDCITSRPSGIFYYSSWIFKIAFKEGIYISSNLITCRLLYQPKIPVKNTDCFCANDHLFRTFGVQVHFTADRGEVFAPIRWVTLQGDMYL